MTFVWPLVGGVLIGLAAALFLIANRRIAGISGLLARSVGATEGSRAGVGVDVSFLVGLVVAGALCTHLMRGAIGPPVITAWSSVIVAGLLVGLGTRLGNGCTSGHGVCGIGSGSKRSMVAVAVFMGTAMLTVFVTHHLVRS